MQSGMETILRSTMTPRTTWSNSGRFLKLKVQKKVRKEQPVTLCIWWLLKISRRWHARLATCSQRTTKSSPISSYITAIDKTSGSWSATKHLTLRAPVQSSCLTGTTLENCCFSPGMNWLNGTTSAKERPWVYMNSGLSLKQCLRLGSLPLIRRSS